MRKIDIIANEKFNGDIEKTIEFLLYNAGEGKFDEYIDELTQDEAKLAVDMLEKNAVRQYGSEEKFHEEVRKNQSLLSLNLTEEEVRTAEKNPYKAKILKNLLKMLIMEGGVIALSLMGNTIGIDPSTIGIVGSVLNGLCSIALASNIIDYVKFKNLKKDINNQLDDDTLDNSSRGRGL